ncbi:MAG: hypothetical protein GX447_00875 [Elusimicrobia bacterium]|nr:hypothetical protein [Elusimicrobiota bacterium]
MKTAFSIVLFFFLASCSKQPQNNISETTSKEKQESPTFVSSSSVLNAPAAYVKNTISAVGQAKEAAALMEKTQQDRLKAASGE